MDFSSFLPGLFGASTTPFIAPESSGGSLLGGFAGGAASAGAAASPSWLQNFSSKYNEITQNPLWRLGMGLMEQGGPSAKPHSFGQDLSRAVAGVQDQQDADAMRQYRQTQLDYMKRGQEEAMKALQGLNSYGQDAPATTTPPAATPPAFAPTAPSVPTPRPKPQFQDPNGSYNGGMRTRVPGKMFMNF